ncbi:Putative exported protein [uncultured Candidatus Thioglobus sp.]|nr:Putative exported protein [uncultured Candidatus Thioglobus sp.]
MKLNTIILTPILLLSQSAISVSYSDTAKITSVDKIYRTHTIREPHQDCYIKEFYQADGDGSATNEIVGGLFGGLIGNQFGGGSGKDAMTVAGALLGASLAHDDELAKSKNGRMISKEVCETRYRTESVERLNHYRVEYEYDGRTFTYTTKSKPYGSTLKIKVNISPKQTNGNRKNI